MEEKSEPREAKRMRSHCQVCQVSGKHQFKAKKKKNQHKKRNDESKKWATLPEMQKKREHFCHVAWQLNSICHSVQVDFAHN